VAGWIIPILTLVLRMLGTGSSAVGRALGWPFRLVPSFAFGEGLLNIASIQLLTAMENDGVKYKPMDLEISLACILYLVVMGCVFFFLVFAIEYIHSNEAIMRKLSTEDSYMESAPLQE
jgi:ATP-binding cassette subfamily A (ABC1) protein 3